MRYLLILSIFLLISPESFSQRKSYHTNQGDKAFSLFKFNLAIEYYKKALNKKKEDSVYLFQKIADSYRLLNDPVNSEIWYKKLATLPGGNPKNKFWLAEALRANQKYDEAKQFYREYKAVSPDDKNIDEIISGLDNIKQLSQNKGLYRLQTLSINSPASDFGPYFYEKGKIFFTSNRRGVRYNSLTDNWSTRNFYHIYLADTDSGSSYVTRVKSIKGTKPNGRFHDGPVAYNPLKGELIFTRNNYINYSSKTAKDKKTVVLKLYSMSFPRKKREKPVELPFNSNDFSNAHPALSPDGNTLYFSSDRPGGYGGTDIYVSTRDANGTWSEPRNLGNEINSRFDEKYPYIAHDGTLYFASNALSGLGGLDVYKSVYQNGSWSKPENIGPPINSNADDFSFIINENNNSGYFASNRIGGVGDDDIYGFVYDESRLDYDVTVLVVDAVTNKPIPEADLKLDCKTANTTNYQTNSRGEKNFIVKGGKACIVDASKTGYKPNFAEISSKDKGKVVTIPLTPANIKLIVSVREQETKEPIQDVAISITPRGKPSLNFATGTDGTFETVIAQGDYTVGSPDFPSIRDAFSDRDADPNTGILRKDYLIPRRNMIVNVPLTANCFSGPVRVKNLRTGQTTDVQPNSNGETRLDLVQNYTYTIEHNGRIDTISTYGLKPSTQIEGPCKFYVGQTWVIRNLYYDLDKWYIRPDAAKELDNLVQIMRDNPTLEVELSSHTDCRQTQRYNMVLSARRAKAAVDYIVSKKISPRRIVSAGYGETKVVNGCVCEPTNDSPCTEEQHQQNRRTEVKVLRY
ncbi:MAG: OmpA family protein [Chitinophagales bacterium]|nr:OmpA family protein [Chitinophagales bacterium]